MGTSTLATKGQNCELKGSEILARGELKDKLDIMIAPKTVDALNTDDTNYLKEGLVLVRLGAGAVIDGMDYEGYYAHYTTTLPLAGQDDSSTAVVLAHDVDMNAIAADVAADGGTLAEKYTAYASSYNAGVFWRDKIRAEASFFLAAQLVKRQRLEFLVRT